MIDNKTRSLVTPAYGISTSRVEMHSALSHESSRLGLQDHCRASQAPLKVSSFSRYIGQPALPITTTISPRSQPLFADGKGFSLEFGDINSAAGLSVARAQQSLNATTPPRCARRTFRVLVATHDCKFDCRSRIFSFVRAMNNRQLADTPKVRGHTCLQYVTHRLTSTSDSTVRSTC